MNKRDKVLILGANGMVGSSIKRKLIENEYSNLLSPSSKELNLINQSETENYFKVNKPEIVINSAAKVGGILSNSTYPAEFIYNNLMINSNVINSAYLNNCKKLINLGSSCIYPKYSNQPIKEDELLNGYLEKTNEAYAIAKISAIKLCNFYNEQYKTNFISLMPTNLFGYGDNYNFEHSHVIPALIRKIHLAKAFNESNENLVKLNLGKFKIGYNLDSNSFDDIDFDKLYKNLNINSSSITLWGTGNALREFLFVDDLADSVLHFGENINANQIKSHINIGTGKDISIKEISFIIAELLDYKGQLFFDSEKPDGTPRKLLDVNYAKSFDWEYKTPLKDGLKLTISNFLNIINSDN